MNKKLLWCLVAASLFGLQTHCGGSSSDSGGGDDDTVTVDDDVAAVNGTASAVTDSVSSVIGSFSSVGGGGALMKASTSEEDGGGEFTCTSNDDYTEFTCECPGGGHFVETFTDSFEEEECSEGEDEGDDEEEAELETPDDEEDSEECSSCVSSCLSDNPEASEDDCEGVCVEEGLCPDDDEEGDDDGEDDEGDESDFAGGGYDFAFTFDSEISMTYVDCVVEECGKSITINGTNNGEMSGSFNGCTGEESLTGTFGTPEGEPMTAEPEDGSAVDVEFGITYTYDSSADPSEVLSGFFTIGGETTEFDSFDELEAAMDEGGTCEAAEEASEETDCLTTEDDSCIDDEEEDDGDDEESDEECASCVEACLSDDPEASEDDCVASCQDEGTCSEEDEGDDEEGDEESPSCENDSECQELASNGFCGDDNVCAFSCSTDSNCDEIEELAGESLVCEAGECVTE